MQERRAARLAEHKPVKRPRKQKIEEPEVIPEEPEIKEPEPEIKKSPKLNLENYTILDIQIEL